MDYTIKTNEEYNSTEIYFSDKPNEAIREALKNLRFRWHAVKKCWYGYADGETVKNAINGSIKDNAEKTIQPIKADKSLIEEYRKQLKTENIWSGDMLDYIIKSTDSVIKLSNGDYLQIDKPNIETRFCFDDEREDCNEMLHRANNDFNYFRSQNKPFADTIKKLSDKENNITVCTAAKYYTSPLNTKIKCLCMLRPADVWEESKNGQIDGLPDKYTIISDEDRQTILKAYEAAAARFDKRVETYLKKYGLSKVRSWTYWANA